MYKILNEQVAVPASSVDLTLSTRPSRGIDANQKKLVTVRSHTENYRQSYTSELQENGTLCPSPSCQLTLQHTNYSRVSWSAKWSRSVGAHLVGVMSQFGALPTTIQIQIQIDHCNQWPVTYLSLIATDGVSPTILVHYYTWKRPRSASWNRSLQTLMRIRMNFILPNR